MRLNTPITATEVMVDEHQSIVSTTDLQGNITYANPYFVEISGFDIGELIGAPQNILRHPDMPKEAFADMWTTIKSGTPWSGLVKNRTKEGHFYWVQANVTPVIENGKAVGYISVRTRPSRDQINATEKIYSEIRNGNPRRLLVDHGRIVVPTVASKLQQSLNLSLKAKILGSITITMLSLLYFIVDRFFDTSKLIGTTLAASIAGLGILSLIVLWSNLSRTLRSLHRATVQVQAMAGGDLTADIVVNGNDEVAVLARSIRQLKINLGSVVGDIRSNFMSITMATDEIANGNMELSSRTESQASSLEETASSMEELASTVDQNAQNAREANDVAAQASEQAVTGGKVVGQVVATMHEISDSSNKIVDIISIIDGIAFQTNILALNAAVEAARAGEQGRGFAVVASEVRALAQRSAAAAKEIAGLIKSSVVQVDQGAAYANQANQAMMEIVESVHRVATIMGEISFASNEQSEGIAQVNDAITLMDNVTQQNSAMVEEAAAAAGSLSEQATHVEKALALFKLSNSYQTPIKATSRTMTSQPLSARSKQLGSRRATALLN
ncbi:methyl-accepting chemotaxis protein [Undibacterium cyanobacteriorum]|uniref:Methyl-accepting chemotaxis protein n=1 Tax=Undibacterium cyanobacteriorum TaxID=3073561 RepID=A0ABY9RLT9_9BURK|nr:methyl-accepting chemotaxis protein [Undibacterium sp. 20NA77.5]WMW81784.1 methyl-accepting chemotaxis protein [Undibacterium sp. 20NA77.5]